MIDPVYHSVSLRSLRKNVNVHNVYTGVFETISRIHKNEIDIRTSGLSEMLMTSSSFVNL